MITIFKKNISFLWAINLVNSLNNSLKGKFNYIIQICKKKHLNSIINYLKKQLY